MTTLSPTFERPFKITQEAIDAEYDAIMEHLQAVQDLLNKSYDSVYKAYQITEDISPTLYDKETEDIRDDVPLSDVAYCSAVYNAYEVGYHYYINMKADVNDVSHIRAMSDLVEVVREYYSELDKIAGSEKVEG